MSLELKAGPTSLERLQTALGRLFQKHGFFPVDRENPEFPAGLTALLLTEDPQRNLEVLDACVILPEALKPLGDTISRWVAGPDFSPVLMQRYGVARAPAVVFLRDGQYVGALNGIRDWSEYQNDVARLLDGPAQPKPIGIPVRAASTQGACA
ncbi:MAG: Hydrogenase expression HyaE [Proteobacteria bacterium]|nr:Hydrogenase expression HyaE [Pseudomonadota bacterium]